MVSDRLHIVSSLVTAKDIHNSMHAFPITWGLISVSILNAWKEECVMALCHPTRILRVLFSPMNHWKCSHRASPWKWYHGKKISLGILRSSQGRGSILFAVSNQRSKILISDHCWIFLGVDHDWHWRNSFFSGISLKAIEIWFWCTLSLYLLSKQSQITAAGRFYMH